MYKRFFRVLKKVYDIFLQVDVLTICKVPIMFHYFPSLVDYKLSVPSKFPGC